MARLILTDVYYSGIMKIDTEFRIVCLFLELAKIWVNKF